MMTGRAMSPDVLKIDAPAEAERIETAIRDGVFRQLGRKGVVVGVSGGIDSSVVAYLSARALGTERVLALFTPEAESSPDSLRLGRTVADRLDIRSVTEDISPVLDAVRCYDRRDKCIQQTIPEYSPGCKCKVVLPNLVDEDRYAICSIVVELPSGEIRIVRPNAEAYRGIVAATNFKQRARKMIEYYYADQLHFAVAGTPNRLEYEQGFFVKNGDGAADIKPIAHLYKSQVYQLAEFLGVPDEIRERVPTTDTYSMPQSQEEFFFCLPLATMDLCLYGKNSGIPAGEVASAAGLDEKQVNRIYRLIDSQRNAARYLNQSAVLVAAV
jgi:NAD+ synthase